MYLAIILLSPVAVFSALSMLSPGKKRKVPQKRNKRKKWRTLKDEYSHTHMRSRIYYKNIDTGRFTNRFDRRAVQCR